MKKVFKVIGGAVLALVVLLAVAYGGFWVYMAMDRSDESAMDDSDLLPLIPAAIALDNAWDDILQASDALSIPKGDGEKRFDEYALGSSWDQGEVDSILEENSQALIHWDSAVTKGHFFNPEFLEIDLASQYNMNMVQSIAGLRDVYKLSLIRTNNNFRNGEFEKGFEELGRVISFLDSIWYAEHIGFIVKSGMRRATLTHIENSFRDEIIFKENALALQVELEKFKANDGFSDAYRFEYLGKRNAFLDNDLESLSEGAMNDGDVVGPFPNYHFKPQKTINKYLMPDTREDIVRGEELCAEMINEDGSYEHRELVPGSIVPIHFVQNRIGKVIIDINSVAGEVVHEGRCETEYRTIATQVFLGANAFKYDTGAYPKSFAQMTDAGYLAVDIPGRIYGWDIMYDSATGSLIYPEALMEESWIK